MLGIISQFAMYSARVVRVMIASPSDVSEERRLASDVLQEWNVVNSFERGLILQPMLWESHALPEMGDRPQAIINRQLLRDADLLIAAFWTRLGSPTGAERSGTVEEIQEHLRANKPAMLYFSRAPVALESVDREQWDALLEFRQECESKGLCARYDDVFEFRQLLSRHIAQAVNEHFQSEPETSLGVEPALSGSLPVPLVLSDDAEELLLTASEDPQGQIRLIPFSGGTAILSNRRDFSTDQSPRVIAKWKGAIQELACQRLAEDVNGQGKVFVLTQYGYATADRLKAR
jgi:hypothetical protein